MWKFRFSLTFTFKNACSIIHSRMFVEQIDKGQNYGKLTRAVSIMIRATSTGKKQILLVHHRYPCTNRQKTRLGILRCP